MSGPQHEHRTPGVTEILARIDDEDVDIVCGWRKDRKDTFVTRRVPSMLALS